MTDVNLCRMNQPKTEHTTAAKKLIAQPEKKKKMMITLRELLAIVF